MGRFARIAAPLALVLGLGACATLLGIDDFEDASTTVAGATSTAGSGGSSTGGGGSGAAGGGVAGSGGGGGTVRPGECRWSHAFVGDASENAQGVATTPNDDIAVAGHFRGTVNFGGNDLAAGAGGNGDGFVALYDAQGSHKWSHPIGQVGDQRAMAVAADASSNVAVVGYFDLTLQVQVPTIQLAASNGAGVVHDLFVLLLNANGQAQWAVPVGNGSANQEALGVAIDPNHGVLVTGRFSDDGAGGPVNFGGVDRSAQLNDVFVARYGSGAGAWSWDAALNAPGDDIGHVVTADTAGDVVIAGGFQTELGTGGHASVDDTQDVFVVKYAVGGGDPLWARAFGSTADDEARAIATDGPAIVVAGRFENTISFDGNEHTSHGGTDLFVIKLDSGGTVAWSRSFGGSGDDIAYGVAVDSSGRVVVTGGIDGSSVDFGDQVHATNGTDVFVLVLDQSGNTLWSSRFGGPGLQEGRGVAVDSQDDIVIVGNVYDSLDLGCEPYTVSATDPHVFLVKLSRQGDG